jgi:hypothetical protein
MPPGTDIELRLIVADSEKNYKEPRSNILDRLNFEPNGDVISPGFDEFAMIQP